MIKQKINKLILKIQENKTKKMQKTLSKPIKTFDEAITRVKNLISL
jgi:hypothetical protein